MVLLSLLTVLVAATTASSLFHTMRGNTLQAHQIPKEGRHDDDGGGQEDTDAQLTTHEGASKKILQV